MPEILTPRDWNVKITSESFPVRVPYTVGLTQLAQQINRAWTEGSIARVINQDNFPSDESTDSELSLSVVTFRGAYENAEISAKDAIDLLDIKGYSPMGAMELLAFVSSHPELVKDQPVIALGNIWSHDGKQDVVAYTPAESYEEYHQPQQVDLINLNTQLNVDRWKFLAVLKK